MLNNLGLPPVRAWGAQCHVPQTRTASSRRIRLGPEFHVDMSFWRLLVTEGLGSPAGRLSAPLYRSYMQPLAYTLWSDASSDSMGGYYLGPESGFGMWWRFGFDEDARTTAGDGSRLVRFVYQRA